MQKKGFLFLLLCLLLAISAQAQRRVRITILEKDTQQPLVGATVQYATSKEMLDVKNTITDIEGKVILSIEKGKELYYPCNGLRPRKRKCAATGKQHKDCYARRRAAPERCRCNRFTNRAPRKTFAHYHTGIGRKGTR